MTHVRACATCADPITVTTRNPNRRFCSPRCRVADWHARNRAARDTIANTANTANTANDVHNNGVANDVRNGDGVHNGVHNGDGVASPKTMTLCPHCQKPVTVLTWLLPPAAAHVATPPVPNHG